MKLKIQDDFKSLIPPIGIREYDDLEESILKNGCLDTIKTWNDIIIDGHNRYKICQDHALGFKTQQISFENEDEAKLWIINNQFARRNLNAYQKSILALKYEEIFREQAKKNQGTRTDLTSGQYCPKVETSKELSKLAGVSSNIIEKVKAINGEASKEVKEQLQSGELSIDKAYQNIRKQKKLEAVQEKIKQAKRIPSGSVDIFKTDKKYSIIYADPPWSYDVNYASDRSVNMHYNTMTLEDICNLPVKNISDTNCILFLWVTPPQLEKVFEVIKKWGFEYSTIGFSWVKRNKDGTPFIGLGAWTRANIELCLIAKRGSVVCLDHSISQIIETQREEHSKKPEIVRGLIERLVGKLSRIELFARDKAEGWDAWGDGI